MTAKSQPGKLSIWRALAQIKLDLALIVLSAAYTIRIPLYIMSLNGHSEIFAGINVELPKATEIVFGLSDMAMNWWYIILPLFVIVALSGAFVAIFLLVRSVIKNPEGNATAQLQLFFSGLSVCYLMMMSVLEKVAQDAVMTPLLKLVNMT